MSWVLVGTAVVGAAASKLKHDREKQIENSDRKLAGETIRYSPWTGMQAAPIRSASGSELSNIFGGALGGAAGGMNAMGGFGTKEKPQKAQYISEEEPWWGSK